MMELRKVNEKDETLSAQKIELSEFLELRHDGAREQIQSKVPMRVRLIEDGHKEF